MKEHALKIHKRVYYGWFIVFMSGLAFFFSAPGQTYSISVFNEHYITNLGYSRSLISVGYSVATTISGLLLIFMGKAIDRFGQRRMMIIVTILLGMTTFFNSFVQGYAMMFVGFFLLRYLGQGSLSLIPNSLVPQWFDKRRAFAISLSGIGNLVATLSVPFFNLWLIHNFGFEYAWRFWSIALLFLFLPLVYIFVINRPEDIDTTIENNTPENGFDKEEALKALERESFTLTQALKTKEFWFVGLMSVIVPMFTTGVTFHFYSMMSLRNVSNEPAALIIGLIAFPAFFMPLLARILIDRYKPKYIFLLTQSMIFIAMAWLMWFVNGVPSAVFFILFYGTAAAIQGVALNVLWPNYFGRKYLGSIRGAATVFMVIGSALGPLPFGIGYDLLGSYNPVIVGMMVMTIGAMVLSLSINKPEKR